MSGTEAGLIIGLIADCISLSGKIIDVYKTLKSPNDLPPAFQEVADKLPLAKHTLEIVCTQMEDHRPDDKTCEAVKPIVDACTKRIHRLESIIQEVVPKLDRWRIVYYKLMHNYGKGNEVEELLKAILGDVKLLAAHEAIKGATKDQVEKLAEAMEDMAKVPSSVPNSVFEGPSRPDLTVYGGQNVVGDYGSQSNYSNSGSGDFFTGQVTLTKGK